MAAAAATATTPAHADNAGSAADEPDYHRIPEEGELPLGTLVLEFVARCSALPGRGSRPMCADSGVGCCLV